MGIAGNPWATFSGLNAHIQKTCRSHQLDKRVILCSAFPSAGIFKALSQGTTRFQCPLAGTPTPQRFPPGPSGDVAFDLLRDPLSFLNNVTQRSGNVVGLSVAGQRVVLVTDPLAAKAVLIDNPEVYPKAGTAFFPGSSLAGNGLLVSDGEIWRRQRQLATPAFRRAAVESYSTSMVDGITTMLRSKRWRDGTVRDVYADFNELTLRITLTALFGADIDSASAKEVTGKRAAHTLQSSPPSTSARRPNHRYPYDYFPCT